MVIFCFFGPDGAGKTTLIKNLSLKLQKSHRIKLSWMRGSHTLTSLLAKLLSRLSFFQGSDNPYYKIRIPEKLKGLWQFLEFASAIPVIISRFILPSLVGYWIIADRYSIDLEVWIGMTTKDSSFFAKFPARVLTAVAQKANAKFYVKADIGTLRNRTQSLPYPEEQIVSYDKLARLVGAATIDTTNQSAVDALACVLETLERDYRIAE